MKIEIKAEQSIGAGQCKKGVMYRLAAATPESAALYMTATCTIIVNVPPNTQVFVRFERSAPTIDVVYLNRDVQMIAVGEPTIIV